MTKQSLSSTVHKSHNINVQVISVDVWEGISYCVKILSIHRTRSASREEKKLSTFLEASAVERWVESAYEAEGAFYMGVLALAVYSPSQWSALRVAYLQRLLVVAHIRCVSPHHPPPPPPAQGGRGSTADQTTIKDWPVYKQAAIFWALVDGIYNTFFKVGKPSFCTVISLAMRSVVMKCPVSNVFIYWAFDLVCFLCPLKYLPSWCSKSVARECECLGKLEVFALLNISLVIFIFIFQKASSEGEWSTSVAEFIRHNDQVLVEASSKLLSTYQEELLPIASFAEFCDVVGMSILHCIYTYLTRYVPPYFHPGAFSVNIV